MNSLSLGYLWQDPVDVDEVKGARSFRKQEGWGPEHKGGRLSLKRGRQVEELGAGLGRRVGWEGSERQAIFFLPGRVVVSGCIFINMRT